MRGVGEFLDAGNGVSAPAGHLRPPVGGLLHQLVLDRADNAKRPAFELVDINEVESGAVPIRNQEPAARQSPERPASIPGHSMIAFKFSLVKVLKSVPEIREHLVTRRRVLASFLREPPGPSLNLMSRPYQRLLFRPLGTETLGEIEFGRAPVLHPVVRATEFTGLFPNLADALYWRITASAHIWTKDRQVSSASVTASLYGHPGEDIAFPSRRHHADFAQRQASRAKRQDGQYASAG